MEHITTTAFHPQSNGIVERLHWQIKDALHARGRLQSGQINFPGSSWVCVQPPKRRVAYPQQRPRSASSWWCQAKRTCHM